MITDVEVPEFLKTLDSFLPTQYRKFPSKILNLVSSGYVLRPASIVNLDLQKSINKVNTNMESHVSFLIH